MSAAAVKRPTAPEVEREKDGGIRNQAADGKFSFEITQLAHFKLKDVYEPRGNGAFLYSPPAIMWVSSELV